MAHGVIAHNKVSQQEVIERMGVPERRTAIIPHGNYQDAIPSRPTQEESRRALGLPLYGRALLFFGQIKEVKGLDVLLTAMPAILAAHPDTYLVIAGRPWKTDFRRYQNLIDGLGFGARCHPRIRYIRDDEVPLYYQACDLVVLPYRRIYQSGVVLLAMSLGKAVLTSDIPGMTDMIVDGETGFLFRSGESEDLATSVNRALGSPDLMGAVARRGLDLALRKHNWDDIGRLTAAFYRGI